ncbi:MAG TPA: arginine ABC transporter ATP-binding protein ArtP, partial [Pantoea sp.]|nr:arginine ABC transporter ATP-binding protein ArtP [Pantoea sp.]
AFKPGSGVLYRERGHIVEQGDASRFTQPQTEAFAHYLSH